MTESQLIVAIRFLLLLQMTDLTHSYTMPRVCQNITVSERQVYDKYFSKLAKWERPVKNAQDAVNVTVRLVLFGINEISERAGIAQLTGYLNIKWFDQVHIWNDTLPYACVYSIHLSVENTWIPEVALINSLHKYELVQSEGVEKVRFFSNGSTSYRPGGIFPVYCQLDLTYLPFDTQVCTLEFESWRYVTEVQKLSFGDPVISTRYWRENEQWYLTGGRYYKTLQNYLSDANYEHLTFELTFQRKTGYYWMNVILPSMIISLAQLSVFTLPIDEVIKLHVSFTCLLAYGVFQLMIIEDMPRSSEHIPLLSIYIDLSMGYIFLSIFGLGMTFVCLRLADSHHHKRRVPAPLLVIAHIFGAFFRVPFPPSLAKAGRQFYYLVERGGKHVEVPKESEDDQVGGAGKDGIHLSPSGQLYTTVFNSIVLPSTLQTPAWNGRNNDTNEKEQLLAAIGPRDAEMSAIVQNNGMIISHQQQGLNIDNHNRQAAALVSSDGRQDDGGQQKKTKQQIEWEYLAAVVDRFTTVVYVIVAIGTPIIMFGIVPKCAVKHPVSVIVFT